MKFNNFLMQCGIVISTVICFLSPHLYAAMADAERWVDNEFQPSTLNRSQQLNE